MTEQGPRLPNSHLPPGRIVARYEIVRELATGGMAVVYEAKHIDLGKRVAMKVMRRAVAADPIQVQRFVLEARAASAFSHPHIIAVTDVGIDGDMPYMVMEYLEGRDLSAKLAADGPMPLSDLADLALPIISAVAAAHAEGVVHRDLKPENIFLAVRGRSRAYPVLLDFGIARSLSRSNRPGLTQAGLALGTPDYMSPEQLAAVPDVDERTDQYALGVILYAASTGLLPYHEENHFHQAVAIMSGPPARPSLLVQSLPHVFDALVLRAIRAERADRFPSVRDLGRALWPLASTVQRAQWAEEFGDAPGVTKRVSSLPVAASPPMTLAPPGEAGPTTTSVRPDQLRALPAFEECSDAALLSLLEKAHAYSVPAHATIVRQGAHGHGCYLLISGEVDIVKVAQDRTMVLARLPAGSTFGQIALVDNVPRTASIVAATETVVVEIGREAFERMLAGTDEVGDALRLHLAIAGIRHLRRATRRLAQLLERRGAGRLDSESRRELVYLQTAVREWALPVDDVPSAKNDGATSRSPRSPTPR